VRYLALCCDYDGTLAEDGHVSPATVAALERLRASGRKLLLVTGRILEELKTVCTCLDLFDRVVAENGASLYDPATREERVLAERPPELFIQTLRDRGVRPLSVGRVVVAAWLPHETTVLGVIRDLGLELQVIFNKDAFMVLPSGVNKASGLAAALQDLDLSPRNIVGIGDAENDHAFLGVCEMGVAVDNALPLLKTAADFVTRHARGAGVVELIAELLSDDLRARKPQLARHGVLLGRDESGQEILLRALDFDALLLGGGDGGYSTLIAGLLNRLTAQGYNFCVVDTEGRYSSLDRAPTLGTATQTPTGDEIGQLLSTYNTNFVINLAGVRRIERLPLFLELLSQIRASRLRCGRPHWLVIDDTSQLLAADTGQGSDPVPTDIQGVLRASTRPNTTAASTLARLTSLLVVGADSKGTLAAFTAAAGVAGPQQARADLRNDDALYWSIAPAQAPRKIVLSAGRTEERPLQT
jgi:hydroxymethylpyrimidine pyrophosphatase-like HAD family hydrolase